MTHLALIHDSAGAGILRSITAACPYLSHWIWRELAIILMEAFLVPTAFSF
jgi:hypothetical protein